MKPVLDPAILSALHETLDTTGTEAENCKAIRNEMRSALNSLLKVTVLYWGSCQCIFLMKFA